VDMNTNWRTAGLQAVGVAVAAAAIFLAFLRPSEPLSLSGIEAGDAPRTQVEPPKGGGGGRRNGGSGGQGSGQAGSSGGLPGGVGQQPGGGIPPPATRQPPPPPATDDGDGPSGSQYGDLVARLLARVGKNDSGSARRAE
jgi:hypothetical protein